MIFGLFRRRDGNSEIVERLYRAIAETARDPVPYRDWGVPDTFEGRFEMVAVASYMVFDRLRELPAPAEELARDLADTIFREFDRALRESGVGDLAVPKRMKTMASAFYGRARAYRAALSGTGPALQDTVLRNVMAGDPSKTDGAARVAAWMRASEKAFAMVSFDDIVAARLPFPAFGAGGAPAETFP